MINMFDIKNLGIRDYIICGLLLVISFLIYKYFTNTNKIKSLEDEINDLNNKINLNKQVMNNTNYETDNYYTTDDTINYKTGQTLETFNNTKIETNTKQNNIECNDEFCYIKRPINNIGQFDEKMNNLSKEVDNIIKSDVYIPIDLKQIINNVYDFSENNKGEDDEDNDEDNDEDEDDDEDDVFEVDVFKVDIVENNNNFNPIIINNEIQITQDDIENNKIIQIPDFINLPITLGQSSKEFELPLVLDENKIISETSNSNINLDEIKNNLDEIQIDLDEKQDNLDIELNKISKEEQSVDKIKNMKINDIKN